MANLLAITNLDGELLGVLRADPVDDGAGRTIQAVPAQRSGYRHHLLEVPDGLLGKRAHEIHSEVRRLLSGSAEA